MFQVTINRTLWMRGKATKPEERRKGLQALLCSSAEMALLTPLGPGTAPSAQQPRPGCGQVGTAQGFIAWPRREWLSLGSSPGQPGRGEEPTRLSWLSEIPPDPSASAVCSALCCSFLQTSKILSPRGSRAIPTPACTGATGDQPNLLSKRCQPWVLPWVLLPPAATAPLSNAAGWLWEGTE